MVQVNGQLFLGFALICLQLLCQESKAEFATAGLSAVAAPINTLYDNLLQREYAGPIVFPNHQVERKAQRSPSLRLRFGRSDPDMINNVMEKRWFGDVNQKPIRSPSLRLRFGRRSDPNMPRHSNFDDFLEQELNVNNGDAGVGVGVVDGNEESNEPTSMYDAYERVVRKPQRLRWGRSVPYEANNFPEPLIQNESAALYNLLLKSDKLRHLLLTLRQFEDIDNDLSTDDMDGVSYDGEVYERKVRKPAPLRLRWGRSTGGVPTDKQDKVNPKDQPTKVEN